ncbi:MAG: selenide, water dikinase SelD, partial [Desulfobacteraceae bacterium]|nr:selenide, water dikinase SelD [Desulfobacteraceae bacterium]
TKKDLKAGDRLILTNPLGTGIINTAVKGGLASADIIERVTRLMATLNRDAAHIMGHYPVHACTDITGFGLLGHLAEMISDTPFGIRLMGQEIPIIPEAIDYAGMGLVPAGAYKNREFREGMVDFAPSVDRIVQDILFDPQTSGGLLIGVEKDSAGDLVAELREKGIPEAVIIGEVITEPKRRIEID